MHMHQTWLVTGVSRGLGRALAQVLLERGRTVVGTTRSGTSDLAADGLRVVALDVTDAARVPGAIAEAIELTGGLDVVVNNAGQGLVGSLEDSTPEQVASQLDVNFVSAVEVLRATLPHLRERGSGHVVNVSSIAALAPLGGTAVYAAAKCALSGLSEALAGELAPFGIGVTVVEPGALRTEFLSEASLLHADGRDAAYEEARRTASERTRAASGHQPGDPVRAAEAIVDAVESDAPPVHLVLGADAVDRARARAAMLLAELDAWENVSRSIAFPAPGVTSPR
jgi:NAD(P)-dependent dehydrogenase (short-subunit alcohol dehydrogenase family)